MASSAKDIQLRELKDTISQLNTIMSEQTELIRSLRTIIEEKTAHEMVLQEQVDYLTKKLFGSSSEKTPADIPGQLNLFNEAEVYQDPELPEEDCSREPRPRKKKATHAELFKGLKVHKEVIPLDEEDKASEKANLRRFLRVYIQVFTGNPLPDCFYNSKIVYMKLPISSITSSACGKTPVAFKYPWPSPLYTTSFVFTFAFESL